MYLKNLTLRGFKSFASATTLALQPGITCVVGPNGSGKSNVVDALAWVMGEQGARALHGSNMADVIFAGTSGRAALGRAQVDLTIDNTDGLRPGMNANAEIVVAEANNALVVPNAAVIRGGYVLVSKKSPSAANAVEDMDALEGYVYVKVETGVSDDSYTEIKSGLQEDDTVAYDTSSVSDDYYSDSHSDSIW